MEITLILIAEEKRYRVQDPCKGRGNVELKRVRNCSLVQQCHFGSEPNNRDSISVITLFTPAMSRGISGKVFVMCNHIAKVRIRAMATFECFAASHCTQWTVGLLSLSAMWAFVTIGHISSITSHSSRRCDSGRNGLWLLQAKPYWGDRQTLSNNDSACSMCTGVCCNANIVWPC